MGGKKVEFQLYELGQAILSFGNEILLQLISYQQSQDFMAFVESLSGPWLSISIMQNNIMLSIVGECDCNFQLSSLLI